MAAAPRSGPSCAVGLVGALLAAVSAGCRSTAQEPGAPPPPRVVVAQPIKKPIVEWDQYTGRLEAVSSVEIRSRVSGYLKSIHFTEGQIVERGALLFIVDSRPYAAEVRRAEANLSEVRARLVQAEAQQTEAVAEQKRDTAQLDLARKRLERTKSLVARDVATQEELDIRESEFMQAQADADATTAKIASAKAAAATASAAIETAQAQLDSAELELDYTEIRAPIAGRVGRRQVTEGNLIDGGGPVATLLTTIVSLDPIHCYVDADERAYLKYARLAREGKRQSSRDVRNPVFLALADEQGYPHSGHIDFVDNRLDAGTGTIRGRAIFPNKDLSLTPGLFARVRLPGSGRYEAVLIPDTAVGFDQAEQFVFVVGKDNIARRQVVSLGGVAHGLRIVRQGLTGEERIVISGLQRVRPDTPVQAEDGQIELSQDDGLPDDYQPVPREQWLTPPPAPVPAEDTHAPAESTDVAPEDAAAADPADQPGPSAEAPSPPDDASEEAP